MKKKGVILFLLIVCILIAGEVYGQRKPITLDLYNTTLEKLFAVIEEKTDYIFFYPENFPLSSMVSIKAEQKKLEDILNEVLPVEFTYRINNRQVMILPGGNKQSSPGVKEGKMYIRGRITDIHGHPLPGASIRVKGSTAGTLSDEYGYFLLDAYPEAILIVSFLGYFSQEVPVVENENMKIVLQENVQLLEDVVILGYGSGKKGNFTGAVETLSKKDFNRGFITSPQDLFMGKMAGVSVMTDGGAPGGYTRIRIRGDASLLASNDPLIIIDGIPVDNVGISGLANSLSTINPNDIESLTVLKDASAAAIYGSRASNGVIIINTIKGEEKRRINYNVNFSVQQLVKQYDVMNAEEYYKVIEEKHGKAVVDLLGEADTDWQKEIFRTAFGQDHNLNISGMTSFSPYMFSAGYTNLEGILKTTGIERGTLKLNLNPSLFRNHLKVNLHIKGTYNKSRFANDDVISNATYMDPTQPVMEEGALQHGYFAWLLRGGTFNSMGPHNPLAMLELTRDIGKIYRLLGNVQVDYNFHFLPTLKAYMNLAYDYSDTNGKKSIADNTSWTSSFQGISEVYVQTKKMELFESYLNYKHIADKIKGELDITAGYSYQHFFLDNYYKTMNADRSNIAYESPSKTQNYLLSFFGRAYYEFADKYMISFTLRNDGSSRFAKGNRWGLFPSAGLSWKIKEESFLKDAGFLSGLKIRLSYGVTGQQDLGLDDYPYLSKYVYNSPDNTAQYQMGDRFYNTLRPGAYDKNIKWEETRSWNAGFDFGFFRDRLTGNLDMYIKKTTDLLNYVSVPAGTNLSNYLTTNIGDMVNKGIELTLNMKPVSQKDISWHVLYNFTWNRNKILKLTQTNHPSYIGMQTGSIKGSSSATILINSVGYPINSFYVYNQVYGTEKQPLEGVYVDRNGDEVINSGDLYHYKKASPDVYMGISSHLKYKRWDFSFSSRISLGNYVYNNVKSSRAVYYELYSSNSTRNVLRAVRETGFEERQLYSDYYVENASFFRMDNVSLGYEFPALFGKDVRLYVYGSVQNAFVISPYSGIDPEVPDGIDSYIYPRPRTFLLNLNISL